MHEKKVLIAIFFLALVLRIGGNAVRENIFFHRPFLLWGEKYRESIESDASWYDGTARAFLAGKGVVSMTIDDYNNVQKKVKLSIQHRMLDKKYCAHISIPPLYPLSLSIWYFIGGMNTLSYLIPQAILGSLTCIFIYLLGKEIFDRKTAIVAGIAVALYPDLIFCANVIRPETLFIFLLTLGFLLLVKGNLRKNINMVYMSGAVFGSACLARITLIPFIPLLFIWQAIFFSDNWRLNFRVAIFTVLVIILFLLPWCMRNFAVFGEFTPFTSETKAVLWSSNKPGRDLKAERYCQLYKSTILRTAVFIKDNFKEYMIVSLGRFIRFWSPYTARMMKFAKLYKGLTWFIVFPLAFYGMVISLIGRQKAGLLIIFIIFHSLLHAGSYVEDGLVYRYPIQPFMCIFAAYGFWTVYGKTKTYFCDHRI